MEMIRRVSVLGATGSVGASTLDLIGRHPERFPVEALTAGSNVDRLIELARLHRPRFVAIADERHHATLKDALAGTGIAIGAGESAVIEAADRPAGWVMAAIVGAIGLAPTFAAIRRGAMVALANKEALVCAGALMTEEARRRGAKLLPVDSEHNAIFQVFEDLRRASVEKLVLTASGGPFRTWTMERMAVATPAEAIKHPTWSMGAKISVDSATLMNKGLEVIEAHHLFAIPEERIEVVIHPQSVLHSLVAYRDGSVLGQLGTPDMRVPISYTLAWPERIDTPAARLDLATIGQLTFEAPDPVRFPALSLARQALQTGGAAPTILNAANEVAVHGFLTGRLGFLDIARVVESTLGSVTAPAPASIDEVRAIDAEVRARAGARLAA
ncbi:MAG: 1-deoxy-D-xylulose-5-phosphate reductoisomerase [Alphaproteobacteria bacterium]|nr:1-deoxy-D-xylulose-5-phosphate reductoisomerase [Alphaproteobacteria bacterium]